LRSVLTELGYEGKDAQRVRLYSDNQSSLALAENPELHQRTKHVDVQYHYIREQVAEGLVDLWYVPIKEMVADGLTKLLAPVKHKEFVRQLNLQALKL
jgi:hypothetical protein